MMRTFFVCGLSKKFTVCCVWFMSVSGASVHPQNCVFQGYLMSPSTVYFHFLFSIFFLFILNFFYICVCLTLCEAVASRMRCNALGQINTYTSGIPEAALQYPVVILRHKGRKGTVDKL